MKSVKESQTPEPYQPRRLHPTQIKAAREMHESGGFDAVLQIYDLAELYRQKLSEARDVACKLREENDELRRQLNRPVSRWGNGVYNGD